MWKRKRNVALQRKKKEGGIPYRRRYLEAEEDTRMAGLKARPVFWRFVRPLKKELNRGKGETMIFRGGEVESYW